ncbi:MAG: OmpH family outer membrane protein [Candidatus Berkiellales bacterium]
MKSLKKMIVAATLSMATVLPFQVLADGLKIAVIDMRTIASTSPQAKAAMEKLKKEFKAREDQMVAADKALKEKADKLQRNGSVMSATEKSKLEKEVMAGRRDIERMQSEFREDAAVRQQEEMKKLVDKINHAVQDIAQKEKFDLVIHSEAAPYASKQLDITDKVVKAIATGA